MDRTTTVVVTADGRELCVETGGDPDGGAVLGFQGSPSGRRTMDEWLESAAMNGVFLISYDRPGYGNSTSHPGRTVRDCASDVRDIASALGVQRLAVWGVSGGGPHALACAALLDGLVCGCVAFSSLAPFDEHRLDWFEGMGGDLIDDVQLALDSPEAAREAWMKFRVDLLSLSPEQIELRAQKLPPADVTAEPYFRWLLSTNFRDAFAPGIEGKWEDGCAYLSPWEVDLEDINVPVRLWHGTSDDVVPIQHSLWLEDRISSSELHLAKGEGHLSVFINHLAEAQGWLLEQF
ncbi:MAG TPA: alpha/beta hydrolase [Acidimicrobiales bacterium]|nr:alpha/beta hydrolase [Acidimicrobiales bacterium]